MYILSGYIRYYYNQNYDYDLVQLSYGQAHIQTPNESLFLISRFFLLAYFQRNKQIDKLKSHLSYAFLTCSNHRAFKLPRRNSCNHGLC